MAAGSVRPDGSREAGPVQIEDAARYRTPTGAARIASNALLFLLSLVGLGYTLELPLDLGHPVLEVQYLGAMLSLALACVFLLVPPGEAASRAKVPWYDVLLAASSLAIGVYVVWEYPSLLGQPVMTHANVALGAVAIVLLLEATRRMLGWSLVLFALAAMAVALWGHLLGWSAVNYPFQRWIYFFYLDENGIYGNILGLLATVVFAFTVFGRALSFVGGSKALIDLTLSLVGRYSGGPAKAAVLGSGMMGTITGSIAVNAVTTGTITIPLMKANGCRPGYAAGVECAASAGGPLLPPVMGIIAFLMAQYLGIPYYQVALAAALPAILYYCAVFFQVHFDAAASGMRGLREEELPARLPALRGALPFIVPLAVIIYALFVLQLAPERAALYGAGIALAVGAFIPEGRRQLRRPDLLLADIARNFLMLAVIGGVAGLIVSPLVLSGVGLDFVSAFRNTAGDSLFLMLVLAAAANLILGLGLPATVTYIVLAVLVAPAIANLGVPILAAHMFTLYFAVAAELTPPAGTAVFVTMSIARSPFAETAMIGMRLAAGIFIIPFVFAYRTELLLMGSPWEIAETFTIVLAGLAALSFGASRLSLRVAGLTGRCAFLVAGAACLPAHPVANAAGIALLVVLCGWLKWRERRTRPESAISRK